MCSGRHKGKSEKWFHKQKSGLSFSLAFMELSLLPSLWRFSNNRHSILEFQRVTYMLYWVYYTIYNKTNPNTEAKQNLFLLPEISFLPRRLLWCWEITLSESQFLSTRSLLNEFSMFSLGKFRDKETSACSLGSHSHYLHQMFWIWSRNQQSPKLSLTQR